IGPGIGPAVGAGVEALAVAEAALAELVVGGEGQRLMIDVALAGAGADDDPRHAEPVAVLVDARRGDLVLDPAPVVPGQEARRPVPSRPRRSSPSSRCPCASGR